MVIVQSALAVIRKKCTCHRTVSTSVCIHKFCQHL